MNRCAAMFLLWLGGVVATGAGIIFTKDGKTWAGRIELRAGPALHITGSSGTHQVPLANVRRAVFGGDAGQVGLRDLGYQLYRGTWQQLPDFAVLKPASSGPLIDNQVTLYPNDATAGYAMVFTGQLHVPGKGVYQFFMGSDDGTRLSLDGKPVIDNDGRHGFRERHGQMELAAGKHDFKLEYFNHSAAALLRFDWSGPGVPRTALSREGKPVIVTTKTMNPATELAIRQPGALAWNGAFIAHEVIAADATKLTFEDTPNVRSLSTVNTAAIFYQAISVYRAQALRGRKSGILLTDGQFIEGKIRGIKNGEVELQSVLFGRKKYNVNSGVAAVVLGAPGRAQVVCRVRTRNGMIHVARTVKTDNTSLELHSTTSTPIKLQRDEIEEIEHGLITDPLNAAWRYWDGLDAAARGHLKSRESTIATQTRAIAQALRERAALQRRRQEAIASLEAGKEALQLSLKSRDLLEADVLKGRAKIEQAQAGLKKETQIEALAKDEVVQAESLQKEMIKAVAAAKVAHEKLMAMSEAEEKQALADIEKQKLNAAAQLKKSEIRLKELEVKSMQDQQAAGNAAANRLKALAALALEQKRLAQAQAHLEKETKAKAALGAQLATAKTATATAQRTQQTAQGAFNAKQTAFSAAKAAVDAAAAAKRVPAVAGLMSAEKSLQQAKLAADMTDKKLADGTATMAALTLERTQLAKALADLGKAHDDKKKLEAKAQMALAKTEAQAVTAGKKAASSRAALVDLVVSKQDPAQAAYKNATNMVAESQVAKAKAGELLKNIEAEVAVLSKAAQAAETAAQVAESESQAVQKDAKKSDAEKDAAKKKSIASRQSADTAKAVHAKLETEKLKPALDQVVATAKVLAKAMADQDKAGKVLDGLAAEIKRATEIFNQDDQSARTETAKVQVSAKIHGTLKVDLAFITKQRDEAAKTVAAAVTRQGNFDQQQMKPTQALALKNKQAVASAENAIKTATQKMAAADAEIKRLAQSRQTSETNLAAAKVVLDKSIALTRQSQELQMNLEKQLENRQKSFLSASTEKAARQKVMSQAENASKQVEKDVLAKLKPAAESKAMLDLERLLHQELEQQLVKESKGKDATLQALRLLQKRNLASATTAHQAAQKLQAEQEKKLTEATGNLDAAATAVQVAEGGLKQTELHYKDHLKDLAEHSKAVQNERGNISALQIQRATTEAALDKFLFTNRALLDLR